MKTPILSVLLGAILPWGYCALAKPPDPALPKDLVISSTAGEARYTSDKPRGEPSEFTVYIPAAYTADKPMPLVVSAHGKGGTGPGEIQQWKKYAEEIGFIVVCPPIPNVELKHPPIKSPQNPVNP